MTRREIDPQEHTVRDFMPYDLVALALLGGEAHMDKIANKAKELMGDQLTEADKKLLHYVYTADGKRVTRPLSEGPQKEGETTWTVAFDKAHRAVGLLVDKGYITRHVGECTITPAGMTQVGMYAEQGLKTAPVTEGQS